MAHDAMVPEDGSLCSRLDRLLARVENFFVLAAGLPVFALIMLAVVNVTGRNFLNVPLRGYIDWIEILMPLVALGAMAWEQRVGGHIRLDMVVMRLSGRAAHVAELMAVLLALVFVLLLVWGSWQHAVRAIDLSAPGWARDSSLDTGLPLWPSKLVVPIAFALLALRLALQAAIYARAAITGEASPAGVPHMGGVEENAAREAEATGGES